MLPLGVKPFYSSEEIESGQRSMRVLDSTLEKSSFGLFFISKSNLTSEWIHFEAGAIAKIVEGSRVVPILLDLQFSDLQAPLKNFQARLFSKKDVLDICKSLNTLNGNQVGDKTLEAAFELAWPSLEEQVQHALKDKGIAPASAPTPIEEVLNICRQLSARLAKIEDSLKVKKPEQDTVATHWRPSPHNSEDWIEVSADEIDDLTTKLPGRVFLIKGNDSWLTIAGSAWAYSRETDLVKGFGDQKRYFVSIDKD